MKTRILLLLLPLLLLVVACKPEIAPGDPMFDDKLPMQQRIKIAVEKDYLSRLGFDKEVAARAASFYKQRGYQPVWSNDSTLSKTGETMKSIISQPLCIGIPEERWKKKVAAQKELISTEILLTLQLGSALQDLKSGFLDTASSSVKPLQWPEAKVVEDFIANADTVTKWGYRFAEMGAHHNDYKNLARGLFDYAFGKSFSKNEFRLPSIKEDSAACYNQARRSLTDKGYLDPKATDSVFLFALAVFQKHNGLKEDGVIGTYTKKALEESAYSKVSRAILSLERWRWRTAFTPRYIWINIPEYTLRLYYNDTLYSKHNVVVGKFDTKTPQLRSRIRQIVSFPYWTVPFSITSKEFLPALKANPNYLAKNHLKIFRKMDEEIDPSTVNWKRIPAKTFPYRVRQEPGYHNSLGVIKFEFSNPFGVYVHDTPSKSLFRNDIRSYSHGCIRCQMPDSLARFILRRDNQRSMPVDTLDSLLARQEHRAISLKHPVDIEVDYITVVANDKNVLTFYPDIYNRDAAYLKWLKK